MFNRWSIHRKTFGVSKRLFKAVVEISDKLVFCSSTVQWEKGKVLGGGGWTLCEPGTERIYEFAALTLRKS